MMVKPQCSCVPVRGLCWALLILSVRVPAQETLSAITDRGFVAHWLVCGPFASDLEGGIAGAIKAGQAPLGGTDFMQPVGGVARVRPRHLLEVRYKDAKPLWMRAAAAAAALDLAPFFPDAREGIAYAAFYAQSDAERNVYVHLQTPLGARLWLNGFLLRDARAAPLSAVGDERFIAAFRPGANLMILEVPGIRPGALAEPLGVSEQALLRGPLRSRTLLRKSTGFEFALALAPVEQLDTVAYVPRLSYAGTFSGGRDNLKQDMMAILFNPLGTNSSAVDLRIEVGQAAPIERSEPPLLPDEERQVRVSIPVGRAEAGAVLPSKVTLRAGPASASFSSPVVVQSPSDGGKVFLVTGQRVAPPAQRDDPGAMERQLLSFRRQAALLGQEPEYGFDLGDVSQWSVSTAAFPDAWAPVRDAVRTGRCATRAAFGDVDERIVCEETLFRNIALGVASGAALLGDAWQTYYAWRTPAIAPQMPQLLAQAGVPGLVSDLEQPGLPPLFRHVALDGTQRLHRHKRSSEGPASLDALIGAASVQRRELLDLGISSDLLVVESVLPPPEPFYLGTCSQLVAAFPSIVPRGSGARDFFEELGTMETALKTAAPASARLLTVIRPGELLAFPLLKQTAAEAESALLTAEKTATFAALSGANYPQQPLDYAWRQLLYWSHPDRLGFPVSGEEVCDMLAVQREIAAIAEQVTLKSLSYLARQVETLKNAPAPPQTARALFVFNPTGYPRTDVCAFTAVWSTAEGMEIVDDRGGAVPLLLDQHERTGDRQVRTRVRFVAGQIPAMGYRVFYLTPRSRVPVPSRRPDAQIENDAWLVVADPATGAIRSLVDKKSGKDFATGPMNRPVLLEEDPSRTNGGRECWTTGEKVFADAAPTKIEAIVTEGMQELVITNPFAGGVLERRVTLYREMDRIDFEMTLDGGALDNQLLAVTFAAHAAGRTPIFGERFGAVAGRFGPAPLEYRSIGADNPALSGAQPALNWLALSPNDSIMAGADDVLPLGPASIVYGSDPALSEAAAMLVESLAVRGIPACSIPDRPAPSKALWSDSTAFDTLEEEAAHGIGVRFALGGPEDNTLSRRLMEALSETDRAAAAERFKQGAALLVSDTGAAPGVPAVPTLILAGNTPNHAANMAREVAESLQTRGGYNLPPQAVIGKVLSPQADSGLALLFPGTVIGSVDADGALALLLAHDAHVETAQELAPKPARLTFRYALLPMRGDWRANAVPAAAFAFREPLRAVETDAHAGRQPESRSYVETSDPGLVITAVKPAGYPVGRVREQAHPRNGLVVRAYNASGRPWEGILRFHTELRRLSLADGLEEPGDTLPFDANQCALDVPPFAVRTFWALPKPAPALGDADPLYQEKSDGAAYAPYWRHRRGAAPASAESFTLVLAGNLADPAQPVRVLAGNTSTDQTLEGVIQINAPPGWSLAPAQVYYALKPGACKEEEVVVLRDESTQHGGIVAWTEAGGRIYRDVLLETPAAPEVALTRTGNQVRATVRNPHAVPMEGTAEIVTLPSFWPAKAAANTIPAEPDRAAFSMGPFLSAEVVFRCSENAVLEGAVVRIQADGNVVYRKVT